MVRLCQVRTIYIIASVFPFLSVLACWGCYYGLGHHHGGRIRTISETVIPFPENRIFPVTMNMECVFLLVALVLREKTIRARRSVPLLYRIFVAILIPAMLAGLSILADLTLVDHLAAHLSAASVFFFGILAYFIASDLLLTKARIHVSWFSWLLPYFSLCLLFGYSAVIQNYRNDKFIYSCGSLAQYTMAFCIFLKIFLMGFEIPNDSIVVADKAKPQ